jgi:hypothetical protein
VVVGKVLHVGLLLLLPAALHGLWRAVTAAAAYSVSLSLLLALMFFVSHNVSRQGGQAEGTSWLVPGWVLGAVGRPEPRSR